MSNFSPSIFLDNLYRNYYLKNKNEWISEINTNRYVLENLSFMNNDNNIRKHYELLRFIIYQLCNHKNDSDYLNFLNQLLFTLLEENAISLEHEVSNKEKLHSLLSIPELYYIFDHHDKTIRISNTKVKQFLELLEKNKTICDKIKEHLDLKNKTTPYSAKRFHPYSKKGGKKRKLKKTQKKKKKLIKINKK